MPQDKTELGKYRIVSQVGEGAMGVVYRAIDPVLNRTVAIKVMSDGIARDDDLRGRFLREAQAAGSLQHPNVITIYDCGEVDGHLFIAMEFVEGHDLETLLDSHASMRLIQKIDIVIDVLGGLAYAHKRGIVHRDIKPANIRIDEDGRARIMDFGIAHLQSSSMTRTGVIVGTPAYMAPEQITGQPISPGTDIFSVGAVLFELLSGVRPFHADTLQGVMYKIVSEAPADLSKLSSGLPPGMNDVVQKALAKDPKERYTSALDMANDLTSVRANLDRTAIMRSVSLRSKIDTQLTDARTAADKAEKAAAGKKKMMIVGGVLAGVAAIALIATTSISIWNRGRAAGAPAAGAGEKSAAVAPPQTTAEPTPSAQSAPPPAVPAATVTTAPTETKPAPQKTASKSAPAPKGPTSAPPTTTAQELALFRSLRTTAMDGRQRAVDAGATSDQLKSGDDHTNAADAAMQQGKVTDAANHLSQATTAWSAAERDARAAAAALARGRAAAQEPVKQLPVAPTPAPISPPVVAAPQPAAQPPANPSVEIQAAVANYAHALESRDVAEVRRAYPGITATQASGWESFFATLRTLKVSFTASELDVSGTTAEARLAGEYNYVTNGGKSDRTPVNFRATFRHDGGGWKLMSVR